MFSRVVIAIALIAVPVAWGYSAGAPPDVCGDLLPKHHVAPQSSASPYRVSTTADKVRSGDTITITIAGQSSKDTIKGFFAEVTDESGRPIGSFDIDPSNPHIQTRNCAGGSKVRSNIICLFVFVIVADNGIAVIRFHPILHMLSVF